MSSLAVCAWAEIAVTNRRMKATPTFDSLGVMGGLGALPLGVGRVYRISAADCRRRPSVAVPLWHITRFLVTNFGHNAESVGKLQPRVALWQPWDHAQRVCSATLKMCAR